MADATALTVQAHCDPDQLRVAIVHPFLVSRGGGEKVIDALAELFPRAEFFTLMLDRSTLSPQLLGRTIHTTFLDRGPLAWRYYQHLSPLYDAATARHDLSGFDLVISSGGPGSKTARVPAGIPHIHYCHSPVRYLWDQYETWLARLPRALRPAFALTARRQRQRDLAAVGRVNTFVANSRYIAERIARYYGAQSTVVYPPVELSTAPVSTRPLDYFLTVGRLVPGKRIELLVEACNRLGRHLIVAGTGPELTKLRSLAGPTVEIMGRVSDEELTRLYTNARAFLFAADEDFGIATAEAQSYGLPAVAYAHGGSLEIVSEGDEASPADGILFPEQTVDAVVGGIQRFEGVEHLFDRERIQARARRFGMDRFRTGIMEVVTNALNKTLAG